MYAFSQKSWTLQQLKKKIVEKLEKETNAIDDDDFDDDHNDADNKDDDDDDNDSDGEYGEKLVWLGDLLFLL